MGLDPLAHVLSDPSCLLHFDHLLGAWWTKSQASVLQHRAAQPNRRALEHRAALPLRQQV